LLMIMKEFEASEELSMPDKWKSHGFDNDEDTAILNAERK
jgi:hypothetical protein